jgi:hypothetical protein
MAASDKASKQPQPLCQLTAAGVSAADASSAGVLIHSVSPFTNVTRHAMLHSSIEFVSGYVAACTSITLLFPVNKLIFRQILDDVSFRDAFRQLRSEGLHNVYRGMLPPLLQKSTSYSIMFGK